MREEMRGEGWRKAIPESRDRVQSRVLVWVVAPLLVVLNFDALRWAVLYGRRFPLFVLGAFGISMAFALVVRALRAATAGGAACGGMICLLMTFWTGIWTESIVRSGVTPLALLFLLTFLATRAGQQRKTKAGLAEGRRGRSAAQVIANLSVAGLCASPLAEWILSDVVANCHWMGVHRSGIGWVSWTAGWITKTMGLAAMVEATADTVSSEIGQAFGGQPVMLTSLRRVAVGTDGAVTMLGSFVGIAGGAAVAVTGGWAMRLSGMAMMVGLFAGICGLFFDSLIGATLERRGRLGNDLVNFASTVFAAGLAAAGCWLLRYFRLA